MKTKNEKIAAIFAISLVALLLISGVQPAQAFDPMSTITNVWTSIWNGVTSFFSGASKAASSGISSISSSVGNMKFEAFSFSNFAPIGFSNIQYISQGADSRLGGDFIQATVNLGTGSASSIEAAIDKTQTDDGKYMFTNRFSLGFSVDKQSCDWSIAKTSTNIYRYSSETKGTCYLTGTCSDIAKKECNVLSDGLQHGAIVAPSSFWSLDPYRVYCLKEEVVASVGTFADTANYNFAATITLKNGTESYSKTITNSGQSDVELGTIARAQFVGLLSSGEACGSTFGQTGTAKAKYVPINDLSGNWKIISKDAYDEYYQFRNSPGFGACYTVGSIRGTANLDTCVVSMNSISNKAQEQIAIGNINQANANSAVLSLTPNNLLNYPQITLKVKASWAGVVENTGIPEIVSLSSTKFQTGSTGSILAGIKNAGDFDGHFKVFAECESGFSQEGTILTLPTIASKSTVTISIPIRTPVNVSEDITKSCTVKIYDSATPAYIVEKKVSVSASPIAKCTPGDEQCVGLYDIQKCTASGQWAFKETCKISCVENIGATECYVPQVTGTGLSEAELAKVLTKETKDGNSESTLCYYASAQKLVGLSAFNPLAYVSKWWSDFGCWYKDSAGNVTLAGIVGILTIIFTFIIFSRLPFLQGMPWIVFLIPVIAAMYVAFKYTYIGWMILLFELAILVVSMFA